MGRHELCMHLPRRIGVQKPWRSLGYVLLIHFEGEKLLFSLWSDSFWILKRSLRVSIYLSIYLSSYLSIYLSIYLSFYLFGCIYYLYMCRSNIDTGTYWETYQMKTCWNSTTEILDAWILFWIKGILNKRSVLSAMSSFLALNKLFF